MVDKPDEVDLSGTVSYTAGDPDTPAVHLRAEDDRLEPGDQLDRYVIERHLGEGGMGVVYQAQDPELGRAVALKVLRGERSAERHSVRLVREASNMAQLSHPNVVTVFDVGRSDDRVWVAMEYIEGQTLADRLAGERHAW